ncbi:hypothetical protein GYA93_23305 [Gordonia desulfuricans]|uniref:Uncharacterized protein n=1 Tax=Gordonia desulfuricans TaxID=89051 RepID=A0A7K3LWY8_9ACTN|nr:hypothetical protein [Gordonia desulfuricans]NDK92461.1 hypothetical protein [Gordonia desulfuricans]
MTVLVEDSRSVCVVVVVLGTAAEEAVASTVATTAQTRKTAARNALIPAGQSHILVSREGGVISGVGDPCGTPPGSRN